MSIVDPAAAKTSAAPKRSSSAGPPKPIPRPAGGANGTAPAPQLKRKASSPADGSQVKIQRKDGPGQLGQTNGPVRPAATPSVARPNTPASTSSIPYRGTAAPASTKTASPMVKRPTITPRMSSAPSKPPAPAPKPAPTITASTSASAGAPKKGYLALLQKAKEKEITKPAAPSVKHESTKILTKKERLALKTETNNGVKGKKSGPGVPLRPTDAKGDASKVQRKPAEVGYQGTARPTKKPEPMGYKGTARPGSAPAPSSRNGTPAAKAKPKPAKGRYDGYVEWSDLDDEDVDEEEDYESDASSDMEGGMWDVEQEEQLALKAAKKEDAEALAMELKLKREKEERKRKLAAMSKVAATKRKF
ncbi:hypothetical protein P153DRAFT_354154 [Dothidotthia symphoricarpi CBS 119687]|uniref:SPT2-domain-containing protein n=1 Tax=Dothidotthia symphoricarpi CBS 119687 TaxID=1392245 RepID=A0A6A6ANB0_9PLEO|nr:uncharacterized protein P153DRAFT_354154 [Dothidotthia symphoricarpi CBS 119687]KAF2132673.1 hypothetical protein P153DRAFT_354154 [Dothidotthia symphoricarpi CBS 119687]